MQVIFEISLYCLMGRLMEMDNKSTKCLHVLQRSGAEKIFEAYKWVQEHQHEFNKEVYGPVLVEVHWLKNSCCFGFLGCLFSQLNC